MTFFCAPAVENLFLFLSIAPNKEKVPAVVRWEKGNEEDAGEAQLVEVKRQCREVLRDRKKTVMSYGTVREGVRSGAWHGAGGRARGKRSAS